MTSLDVQTVDRAFRQLNRPVWIITAAAGSRRGGLVATWVSPASLDPQRPVLLAALAPNHFTTELIQASGAFAAHLLNPDEIGYAWRFGLSSGRNEDKFAGIEPQGAATGSPILGDVGTWLDCWVFKQHSAGDRILFWADVLAGKCESNAHPLGEQDLLGAATPEQKRKMRDNLLADIGFLRPLADVWRSQPG